MTLIVSIFPIDSEYLLLDYQPGLPLPKSFPVDLDGGCLRSSAGLFSDPFSSYLALKLKKCWSLMEYYLLDLSFDIITYRIYFQLSCVIMFEYYSS